MESTPNTHHSHETATTTNQAAAPALAAAMQRLLCSGAASQSPPLPRHHQQPQLQHQQQRGFAAKGGGDGTSASSSSTAAAGGEASGSGDEGAPDQELQPTVEQLTAELREREQAVEELQGKVNDLADSFKRSLAEMENVRQRTARQVENAQKFAVEVG